MKYLGGGFKWSMLSEHIGEFLYIHIYLIIIIHLLFLLTLLTFY